MSGQREQLSSADLAAELKSLPGWSVAEGKLHREYKFPDFTSAFGFMAAAATIIEKVNHHPEWFNVYGTVRVDLWTHSSGGITGMDIMLAAKLDAIAGKLL